MKLFGRGKEKPQEALVEPQSARCSHPVTHQVALHEDPSNPLKTTGIKCSLCGELLEWRSARKIA